MRDIAGMIRSINYAVSTAMLRIVAENPEGARLIEPQARRWEEETVRAFTDAYKTATQGSALHTSWDDAQVLLKQFVLEKALYELRYEMNSRLDWVRIPLRGILDMTADCG